MFDNIKDAITFTKGERTAIIVLAAVILLIIAANFFVANRPSDVKENLQNLDSIMALHEKAVSEQLSAISSQQSVVNRDVSHTSEISNSQQPKAKVQKAKSQTNASQPKVHSLKPIANVHINSADTTELMSLPGIGFFFARNIVSYREKLGGFVELDQLLEVYAFDSARLETITPYINVDSVSLRKINVNTDDFKTILRHPYIEYEDVKKIVNYREKIGFIKNWEEYLKVVGRNDVDERLRWYLEF